MAKKTKNDIGKIIALASTVLGIVAIIMLFLPAIAVKNSDLTYTGLQVAFGYSETKSGLINTTVTTEYFAFSFMNLLTYILVIAGVVFTVLGMLGKGSKFATLISAAAFLLAGIFFFLTVAFSLPTDAVGTAAGLSNLESVIKGNEFNVKDYLTLAVGPIIGGICSILAALANGYKMLTK